MRSSLFVAALVVFGSLSAHATNYTSGKATLSKTLVFQDASGKSVNFTSGAITMKLANRPLWGSETLQIKTIQGTIAVKIAKANFTNNRDFTLPAGALPFALRGSEVDQIAKADARTIVQQCSMSPIQLAVNGSDGQPVIEHRQDLNGNPLADQQLIINLCANDTNGRINVKQSTNIFGCSGTQQVLMQQTTTTPTYKIEILDASSGASLGEINASADSSNDDVKVKDLSSCQ